ncbi:hypothetical protein A2Y85_01205 [candidate division WOR-3 bacterium RBG_13_43_14]|uniref:Uncharacterized protein n=1 Tax=candidate division WOR-3 bacterium RBG_13_43_14 TaxID=1802590 RepID=A0A1F4U9G4_UNCW3|nr:MAG: hypothetical protein A2Y85_01205 [candidate division WOR-3 bacterium RBG_13_43_14]
MHICALFILTLVGADFTICNYTDHQIYPCPIYANNQYYVFWTDYRSTPIYGLYGTRITVDGTVLDPNGKLQFQDSVFTPRVDYDGSNFMVVWREGC